MANAEMKIDVRMRLSDESVAMAYRFIEHECQSSMNCFECRLYDDGCKLDELRGNEAEGDGNG